MDAFVEYTIIDWIVLYQVVLIWFYMAYNAGLWIFGIALRKGWRWWNRKDEKLLALDSFYDAFNLEDIQPGNVIVVTTESGMTISIHKPKGAVHGPKTSAEHNAAAGGRKLEFINTTRERGL